VYRVARETGSRVVRSSKWDSRSKDGMMIVADYVAEVIEQKKVTAVFEMVGGMITFLLDALHRRGATPIVSMHHEQGAAFAAEGAARMTGRPCVAMATSGPGATNLLTAIGSCYFDSTPAVFITGQVNTYELKNDSRVRQNGFQETDIVSVVAPLVKKAWAVRDAKHIPEILEAAFNCSVEGRPGPVLIDIPMDLQRADIEIPSPTFSESKAHVKSTLSPQFAGEICRELLYAKRPMILVGAGVRISGAVDAFREFIQEISVPVVHSLMAVDTLPHENICNFGMIGSYGNRWSNLAISDADVLLVLGSRLDVRQTGSDIEGFVQGRTVFHIDCDEAELNLHVKGCKTYVADLAEAIPLLLAEFKKIKQDENVDRVSWKREIESLRLKWPDTQEKTDTGGINPNEFMHVLSKAALSACAYVVDVGQHQMWAAQSLELTSEQRFITSGGMGAMGFALPTAIGVAVSNPAKMTVVIAGDGSFQCNIQELQTVFRLGLPIKIVVINNNSLGMVRQFQQSYFNERYQSTVWGYSAPDFAKVAEAYGIAAQTIEDGTQMDDAVRWLLSDTSAPSLLQVIVPIQTNAYPKLAFGKGMKAMEPHILSEQMETT